MWMAEATWVITAALDLAIGALIVVVHPDLHPDFDTASTRYVTALLGMTDRLAAIGGTLEVHSSPSDGTTVEGRIPAGAGGV